MPVSYSTPAPNVVQIADAVWDEIAGGHVAAGSFGSLVYLNRNLYTDYARRGGFDSGYTEENVALGASLLPNAGLVITGIVAEAISADLTAEDTNDVEQIMDSVEESPISIDTDEVKMVFMVGDGVRVTIDNTRAGANDIGIYWFQVP